MSARVPEGNHPTPIQSANPESLDSEVVAEDDEETEVKRVGTPLTFNEAKAERERWRAKQTQLEYERQAGLLVPVKDVKAGWVEAAGRVRTKIMNVPTRFKQQCPETTLEQFNSLESILREALEEIANEPRI